MKIVQSHPQTSVKEGCINTEIQLFGFLPLQIVVARTVFLYAGYHRRPVAVEIVGTIGHIGVIEIVCSIIVNLVVTINTP